MVRIPLLSGDLTAKCVTSNSGDEHLLLYSEPINALPLVRIHSECLTGDVFGSLRCDCGEQLQLAIDMISSNGGIIIYLRQEGRGIGLAAKLRAYELQECGLDTYDANIHLGYPADARTYGDAAIILRSLSVTKIKLITNNPHKVQCLRSEGIEISEVVPCLTTQNVNNSRYLAAKKERMSHWI